MVAHTESWLRSLNVAKLKSYLKLYKKIKKIAGMTKSELLELALSYLQGGSQFVGCKNCRKAKCLNPDCEHCGAGFFNVVFGKQKREFNKTAKATLARQGDQYITGIKLFASLLSKFDKTVSNIVMLGKLDSIREKYSVDELFHLGILFSLKNGATVSYEKGETVLISDKPKVLKPDETRYYDIGISHVALTLNKFVETALKEIGADNFFVYSGLKFNCQMFISQSLQANGLMSNAVKEFGVQNTSEFVNELPKFNTMAMNYLTGVMGRKADEDDEKYGSGFAEENKKIKDEINKNKNKQTAEYVEASNQRKEESAKIAKSYDNDYEGMIEYLSNMTGRDAADLRKLKTGVLTGMVRKEQTIEFYAGKAIELGISLIYDRRKNKFRLKDKYFANTTLGLKALDDYILEIKKDTAKEQTDAANDRDKFEKDKWELVDKTRADTKLIAKYENEGFDYINGKVYLDGNGYDLYDEEGITKAKVDLFNKIDKLNNYSLSLGEEADKWGWHYDEDRGLWFMINEDAGVRQYIENMQDAIKLSPSGWQGSEKATLRDAMQTTYRQAQDHFYWDDKYNAYSKWTKDAFSRLDDYTGNILSKVLSYAPPPFDTGFKLIKSFSELTTGAHAGDYMKFIKAVPYGKIKEMYKGKGMCHHCCGSGKKAWEEYHNSRLERNKIILNPKFYR